MIIITLHRLPEQIFSPHVSLFQVTPMSDRDFGRYNCTARNNIGVRYQEFILAQAGECVTLWTREGFRIGPSTPAIH